MFVGTASVLTGFVLAAYATDVLEDSELDTVDARFAVRGDENVGRLNVPVHHEVLVGVAHGAADLE